MNSFIGPFIMVTFWGSPHLPVEWHVSLEGKGIILYPTSLRSIYYQIWILFGGEKAATKCGPGKYLIVIVCNINVVVAV